MHEIAFRRPPKYAAHAWSPGPISRGRGTGGQLGHVPPNFFKSRVLATVKNSALNAVFPITLRSQFPNLGQTKNSYRNSMLLIRH